MNCKIFCKSGSRRAADYWHCPHAVTTIGADDQNSSKPEDRRTDRRTPYRFIDPRNCTTANLKQRVCCCRPMQEHTYIQTDGRTRYRFVDPRNSPMSVRLSVCLSVPAWANGSKPAASGLLLWARRAGDIDRLLQQRRRANAGSATLSAYVRSRTQRFVVVVL